MAVRKLLERIALRAGFDVETARDGQQAMEKLAVEDFDIVIVDLMMPRVSGYDLVQKISTLERRPCVIVATAMLNSEVSKLDDSMVRRVIKKPFDIEAVAKTLIETARELASSADASGIATVLPSDVKVPIADEPPQPLKAAPEDLANPNDDATPPSPVVPAKPPRQ